MFPKYKHKGDYEGHETLPETPSEQHHEVSKGHEYDMSCFMKYEIWTMKKCIHHILVHIDGEELERVDEKCYEKSCFYHGHRYISS